MQPRLVERFFASSLVILLIALMAPGAAVADTGLYKSQTGPFAVAVVDREWNDGARNRVVPARLFIPQTAAGQTFPVVVFSHGLWADRQSYEYFARHIASHGYVVILPQHPGSDARTISCLACDLGLVTDWMLENPVQGGLINLPDRNFLQSSIKDPDNLVNRPLDVSFVIDQVAADPALSPVADASRVGVAGHSFGAYTAMASAGMLVDLPEGHGGADRSFRDPRITATFAMSAQGPGTMGISEGAWFAFGTPAMFLTGTHDYGAGPSAEAWRRTPFDQISGSDKYLLTINGAGHGTFAHPLDLTDSTEQSTGLFEAVGGLLSPLGLGRPNPLLNRANLIKSMGTAFFDTYLKQDPSSRAWLSAYYAGPHDNAHAESKSG